MLALLLLISVVLAAERDKANFLQMESEVRLEISRCRKEADLDIDEQLLNLEVLEASLFNMNFCCECARKAKSYYDRDIEDSNYTMVTKSAWRTLDAKSLSQKIARKMISDTRKQTIVQEWRTLHVGCALKNRFISWVDWFGKTAMCLVHQESQ